MAEQEIQIFAKQVVLDPVKGSPQRRPLRDEEWLQGWARLQGVTNQQLNMLFNLLTHYAPPSDICPYPFPQGATIPTEALVMDGQAITQQDQPILYAAYGSSLPDMTADNLTGFLWVVRNH